MTKEPDDRQIAAAIKAFVGHVHEAGIEYDHPSDNVFKCHEYFGLYEAMWDAVQAVIDLPVVANDD